MPRTCTGRPKPTSRHQEDYAAPGDLRDKPACTNPKNPGTVRPLLQQEDLNSEADHIALPSPSGLHHSRIFLVQVESKCVSSPTLPSRHFQFYVWRGCSAEHAYLRIQRESDGPHSWLCLATGYLVGRNALQLATAFGGNKEVQLEEMEPSNRDPSHSATTRVDRGSRHRPKVQQQSPATFCIHPTVWKAAARLHAIGATAELGKSWPSWSLPRRCRAEWRCPAAELLTPQTWRRGEPHCCRSPGFSWPAASWPPSLQLFPQLPEARSNRSSRFLCAKESPSNIRDMSPSQCTDMEKAVGKHLRRLATFQGGKSGECNPSLHLLPAPEPCRCSRTTGIGQTGGLSPIEMTPFDSRAPGHWTHQPFNWDTSAALQSSMFHMFCHLTPFTKKNILRSNGIRTPLVLGNGNSEKRPADRPTRPWPHGILWLQELAWHPKIQVKVENGYGKNTTRPVWSICNTCPNTPWTQRNMDSWSNSANLGQY